MMNKECRGGGEVCVWTLCWGACPLAVFERHEGTFEYFLGKRKQMRRIERVWDDAVEWSDELGR